MSYLSRLVSAAHRLVARVTRLNSVLIVVVALIIFAAGCFAFAAPINFPSGSIIRIERGTPVSMIANQLAAAHIIAHPMVLRALLRLSGESGNVQTGAYRFSAPQNAIAIAYRLVSGSYDLPLTRITFIEGMTLREDAEHVTEVLPGISAEDFLSAAGAQEGYLFPDTYFFQPSVDATDIVTAMRSNFNTKIASISGAISASGHSLSDIVTMASLVEKEARTSADRRMVAGILWNRVRLGMPLQVDAVFGYIFNRATYAPSIADLAVKSPYNTYLHAGLPPGPIDNPSLTSLEAAATPMKTNYLYYLTGKDGLMHYATTYAQHQANLRRYLQ